MECHKGSTLRIIKKNTITRFIRLVIFQLFQDAVFIDKIELQILLWALHILLWIALQNLPNNLGYIMHVAKSQKVMVPHMFLLEVAINVYSDFLWGA